MMADELFFFFFWMN